MLSVPGGTPAWAVSVIREIQRTFDGLYRLPLRIPAYNVSDLPSAAANFNSSADGGYSALIFVKNETGGAVPAFTDGTNWRRVTDRNVVS